MAPQAHACAKTVDQAAEDTDEEDVLCDVKAGDHIREHTGQHGYHTGIEGKPLADKLEADPGRAGVQQQVDRGKRDLYAPKLQGTTLDQAGDAVKSTREQVTSPVFPRYLSKYP